VRGVEESWLCGAGLCAGAVAGVCNGEEHGRVAVQSFAGWVVVLGYAVVGG
jgi:diaminopimelate epimerase